MAEEITGYCVRCRDKKAVMVGPTEVAMRGKGGKPRRAMTGNCKKCNTKMFKIVGLKK